MSRLSSSLILTLISSLLLGAVPTSARAEMLAVPSAEREADALQQDFSSHYDLFDRQSGKLLRDAPVHGSTPNWYELFRPTKPGTSIVPKVDFGIVMTGAFSYTEGGDLPIAPASTTKVFTSTLALKYLGPDFTYTTRAFWRKNGTDAGYIHLLGVGDPTLQPEKLAALIANDMIRQGVKKIYGDLLIEAEDSRWENPVIPEGWQADDRVSIIPGPLGLVGKKGLKQILKANLAKAKIVWDDAAASTFPESAAPERILVWKSKPLREMIQPFMLLSLNTLGEGFLRKVGEVAGSKSAPDLLTAALPLLREWAALNVGAGMVTLNDGCGLSRTSRVTANAMVKMLTEMKSESFFADFEAALPIAGDARVVPDYTSDMHRTLYNRMKATPAEGTIHAKTGTLNNPMGAYQLAGYFVDSRGSEKTYTPFAILTRTNKVNSAYTRQTEDDVLSIWARLMTE